MSGQKFFGIILVVIGLPIFGGYEDKTKNPDESSHEVNIRCLATFGGVEINNG